MSTLGLFIIITLILSAFFSGVEIAFVSSNRLVQELDLKRKILPARLLADFFNNPSRLIGALLLGNNIALVVYGIAFTKILEPWLEGILPPSLADDEFILLLLITIISTLVILISAEFIPKVLFRINPNTTLKFFAVPIWLFFYLFYPINMLYIGLSELLLKYVFRFKLSSTQYEFSAIDLEEYVKEYRSNDEEVEEINQEIQMIQNAMSFKFVKLRECKIPRTEIKAVEIDDDIDTLQSMFTKFGMSKIMVYEETIDNLIGYVHASELFDKPETIRQVTRKIEAYPETMTANTLLSYFIQNRKNVAVVVDEFGGTSGIVTMEDIIEEIFGEIQDEHDKDLAVEQQLSEKDYLFSTRLEIDYINEKYKLNIPESEEYGTLAGFIIHHHESIPHINEEILIEPFLFTVTKSHKNKLEEVKLRVIE
ncbi:MAG TPA: hemolysin family protein [Bacteroidales bacterium]